MCLWAARQVSSGTRVVAGEHAEALDGLLAEEAAQLLPGQVRGMVDARVAAIDSDAAAIRARLARDDARVYLVPQPDTVSTFGATLPAEQAAACYDALDSHARALRAAGDPRSLDHIRCDTLVERVTGAVSADQAYAVELQVVMTDRSLLGATSEPATLTGYGSMPLDLVRDLTASSRAWVRRLLTDPLDATVMAVDTKRRRFDSGLRRYLEIRDRRCRNPVCSAPLRDIDHRVEHADGGPTTAANGDGYCTRCHHLKHHPRIDVHAIDRSRPAGCDDPASNGHAVGWTGPSGRTRVSIAPPARGHGTATHDQVRHRARLLTGPIPDPRSAHRPETSADPPGPA